SGEETPVPSPMQGTVVEVKVAEGQAVRSGETVIVIESMKMEVEISTPVDGVVKSVLVQKGDQLEEGQSVVIIA
ncbi:MAG: biotin/lipoyl-binding protein, partial [Bacteroidales bacterium]|nr:biotin/lipoyl-binding protein [Bacteroidales bacterium]